MQKEHKKEEGSAIEHYLGDKETEHHDEIEKVLEFSALYRWQHWIRALTITVLTITGFYIAYPVVAPAVSAEPDNFLYALFRSWHQIFGFLLIGTIIFKTYLFLTAQEHKMERDSLPDLFDIKVWLQQIGYYLFMTKHPKLKGVYNPVQFAAYIFFYILMFVLIITGLVLYVHVYHEGLGGALYDIMRWFEVLMGGLANTREIHHIATWGVIIFILAHVYMAIFNAVFGEEGAMDAIFSGLKWHKKH